MLKKQMTVIELFFNDGRPFWNINDVNTLRQNDDECRHQTIIIVKVVNDAAPWSCRQKSEKN